MQQVQQKYSLFGHWSSLSGSDHSPESSDNSVSLQMELIPTLIAKSSKRVGEEHDSSAQNSQELERRNRRNQKKRKDKDQRKKAAVHKHEQSRKKHRIDEEMKTGRNNNNNEKEEKEDEENEEEEMEDSEQKENAATLGGEDCARLKSEGEVKKRRIEKTVKDKVEHKKADALRRELKKRKTEKKEKEKDEHKIAAFHKSEQSRKVISKDEEMKIGTNNNINETEEKEEEEENEKEKEESENKENAGAPRGGDSASREFEEVQLEKRKIEKKGKEKNQHEKTDVTKSEKEEKEEKENEEKVKTENEKKENAATPTGEDSASPKFEEVELENRKIEETGKDIIQPKKSATRKSKHSRKANSKDEKMITGTGKNNNEKEEKEEKENEKEKEDGEINTNAATPYQAYWEGLGKDMEKSRNDMLEKMKEIFKDAGDTAKCRFLQSKPEESKNEFKWLQQQALEVDVQMKRLALTKKDLKKKMLDRKRV